MAQVKKYQSGGLILENELLIDIGGNKYLKSDVVNILKNLTLRDSYSIDFSNNNEEQNKLFNQIADIYADGLNTGKMRFDSDGRHILDSSGQYYNIDKIIENPKTQLDFFNNLSVRVMDMFELAKQRGYIRPWESKVADKTKYSFDLKNIIRDNYFNKDDTYTWGLLFLTWAALDPMDKTTKIRGIENRRNALYNAIIDEANKIDNDPKYREKYSFEGEMSNPMAYKEYTRKMRDFAEHLKSMDTFDESLLPLSTAVGADISDLFPQSPDDTDAIFTTATPESLDLATKPQNNNNNLTNTQASSQEEQKKLLEKLKTDIETNGILRYFDPLSTLNTLYFDSKTNKFFTLVDDLSKVGPLGLLFAQVLQPRYAREKILSNWYNWSGYSGYLENLTNYFSWKSGYHIYALTKGPLSHTGKRFFIKRPSDRKPIEVKLKRTGVDYYAYDLSGKLIAKLGNYYYDLKKLTITTGELLNAALELIKPTVLSKDEDTGEPIPFATSHAFKDPDSMLAYWLVLGRIKISQYDPRRFEDILKGVSMQFLSLKPEDLYKYNAFNNKVNPRTWHGTRFSLYVNRDGHVTFTWVMGNNELVFVSNLTKEEFLKKYLKTEGNIKYIAPGFIKKVIKRSNHPLDECKFDIIGYKSGGKLIRLSSGGSLFDTYASLANNKIIKPIEVPKEPIIPIQLTPLLEGSLEQLKILEQPRDFTVADGVRLGASILDLTGAFMLFPKGLNIASAAVSGVSLAGYIGADLMDVLEGKQELWPTLKRDAEIAGVLAIALINPVKAGQIAPALAKIVPMVPKIAGLLWTYDIISDENSRRSIMDTLDKVQHMRISEITSLDLTNLAFIGRTLIGAKMGFKSTKNKLKSGFNKKFNKAQQLTEIKYQIKDQTPTTLTLTKGSGKNKTSTLTKDIKLRIVDEYNSKLGENEPKITLEDVSIFNKNNLIVTSESVPVKWDFPNPMSESWAPGRLFERAVLHGSIENGYVTRESTWLGRQLRKAGVLGENFDVPFSDEAIIRAKQELYVNNIARNLYGGIDEIKKLSLKISDILETPEYKQADMAGKNQKMLDILKKYGYIFLPHTDGNTPIYKNAVSKAGEIQQVAASLNGLTDLEAATKLLNINNIEQATLWKGETPQKLVTSEMLRRAYTEFLNAKNSSDYIKWLMSPQSDLLTMAEHLSSSQPAEGYWESSPKLLELLLGYIDLIFSKSSDSQIKEKFNAITDPTQQKNFILKEARKLLAEGKLRGSDMELILNAYNLVKNSKAEDLFNRTIDLDEQPQTNEPNHEVKSSPLQRMDELESVLGKYLTGATIENMLRNPAEVNNTLESLGHPELLQPFNEYKELLQKNAPSEPMKQKIEELQKEVENRKQTKKDIKQANESLSEEKILEAVDSDPDIIALRETLENLSDDPTSIFGQSNKQTVLDNLLKKYTEIYKKITADAATSKEKSLKSLEAIELRIRDIRLEINSLRESEAGRRYDLLNDIGAIEHYLGMLDYLNEELMVHSNILNTISKKILRKPTPKVKLLQEEINKYKRVITDIEQRVKENKRVLTAKFGTKLSFASKVMYMKKLQSGGTVTYLPVGKGYKAAILPNFNDPYGTGWNSYLNSWYSTIGSKLLESMLDLIGKDPAKYLGTLGLIYHLNQQKAALDTKWNDTYKKNNGAYEGSDVGEYQKAINALPPVLQGISNAYANGRYRMYNGNVSSGEYTPKVDSLKSAITFDKVALGNKNWFTDEDVLNYKKLLQSTVGNLYKLVSDKNGYIYPVATTQTELGEDESWFYKGVDDSKALTSQSAAGNPDGSKSDESKSGPQDLIPTLPETFPNPNYNDNWLDLIKLGVSQIGTIDARNKIKFRPINKETYNLVDRVYTGNLADRTRQQYSSLFNNAPTSSDARYNTAVKLNLGVNYVKALQEAFDKDREVFYDSLTKAQQTQYDNIKRQYETYNENLANYTALLRYHDEINELMTSKLWQNVENFLAKKSVDIDNLNKIKLARYWLTYSAKIDEQYEKELRNLLLGYWNQLSTDEKAKYGNNIATYLTSTDFTSSGAGRDYNTKLKLLKKIHDDNVNALIDGIYTTNPKPITYSKTYDSTFKDGGQIQMAKKGTNINWAKIETARMVNKSINESIKEANKSIRAANRELQKTIRSAASMMKKLNTQGLK